MRIRKLALLPIELRDHVLVMENRSCDQMREIGHEQRVVRQRIGRDLPAVSVHQERNLGERVEGDADRQQDMDREMRAGQRIDVLGDEAGIFEDAEHEEIADDTKSERRLSVRRRELRQDEEMADAIVEGDRDQQQGQEWPAAGGVKSERGRRQPDHRRQIAAPPEPEVASQHGRQEQQDERIGIEQHQAAPAAGIWAVKHTRARSTTRRSGTVLAASCASNSRSRRHMMRDLPPPMAVIARLDPAIHHSELRS